MSRGVRYSSAYELECGSIHEKIVTWIRFLVFRSLVARADDLLSICCFIVDPLYAQCADDPANALEIQHVRHTRFNLLKSSLAVHL